MLFFFVIASIGLGGYIVYDKLLSVKGNDVGCPKCEACNCANTNSCENAGTAGEQMISAKIGEIYISGAGEAYFKPEKSARIYSVTYNVEEIAKKAFGTPKTYEPKSDKFPDPVTQIFSYKLDLSGVRSVTEVELGNAGTSISYIFIHNDGRVSELSFFDGGLKNMDGTTATLKLYKYVSGYSNVVSAVQDSDYDAHFAKLYDKCGNGINYSSPRP